MIYLTSFKKEIISTQEQDNKKIHLGHQIAHELLAYGLMEEYGISKENIILEKGEYGKPYLKGFPNIFFNLSHCKEMAVCKIADKNIGVDIEEIRAFPSNILKKVLTDREKEQLEKAEKKEEKFFQFWTLKESFIKAIGKGLAFPLKEVEFILPEDEKKEIISNQKEYSFHQYFIGTCHILSVCTEKRAEYESEKDFKYVSVSRFFNSFITD